MPNTKDVLTNLRQHLVNQGVVRKASTAGSLPPMFVELPEGAPAPGEREGAENDAEIMVTVFAGGDIPHRFGEGTLFKSTVDVHYRTAANKAQRALDLDASIRSQMVDPILGVKLNWTMATLLVIESRIWAGLQPIGASAAQGHHFVTKFYFEIYS